MVGSRVTQSNGFWQLAGALDEHVGYDAILQAPPPWRLDLGKAQSINSLGVRAFMQFVARANTRPGQLELHRCSTPIVDMLNAIPSCLGSPPDPSVVKSVLIPYGCKTCGREDQLDFVIPALEPLAAPRLPPTPCRKCGAKTEFLVSEEDCFVFLTALD